MISKERPNHAGVAAVRVTGQKGREVTGAALTEIGKGDVLSFPAGIKEDYTFGAAYKKGAENVKLLVPKQVRIKPGTILYRTKTGRFRRIRKIDPIWKNTRKKFMVILRFPLENLLN